jgi:glucosamine 6-phosphate synthetase-like amidotransferase/phosphosugar isomerase protein
MIISFILKIFLLGFLYDKLIGNQRNTINCGLFGYSGKSLPDYRALKLLAIDSEARGKDSTGIYGNGLWKTTNASSEAVYSKEFDNAIRSKLVIGHTRYATMGAKNKENAHPYEFTHPDDDKLTIIGSHNGWLIEPEWQAVENKMDMPAVDSMLI